MIAMTTAQNARSTCAALLPRIARRSSHPAAYPLTAVILLLVALLGWTSPAAAQTYTISPPPFLTALDNSGNIINNGCIWTYTAGTTTAATTYSDAAGTPNANPIRSDSAGRFTAFLTPGNAYKFVYESACTPPAHGTTLRTADNISAIPPSGATVDVTGTAGETINAGSVAYLSDGSGSKTAGQWYNADADFTYASNTAGQIGVAVSSVSGASSGTFRISGRLTGLSSLTLGSSYYVSATAGALTATPPTNIRRVGTADSATSLVINPTTAGAIGPSGNAIGAAITIGTLDSQTFNVKTNNTTALTVDTTQFIDSPTQPRALAFNSANLTVTAGNTTALTMDSETFDVGSMHSTSSNTSRVTIPTGGDGLYLIYGSAKMFSLGVATKARLIIKKNTTTELNSDDFFQANNANNDFYGGKVIALAVLVAGDFVELYGAATTNNVQFGDSGTGAGTLVQLGVVKLW